MHPRLSTHPRFHARHMGRAKRPRTGAPVASAAARRRPHAPPRRSVLGSRQDFAGGQTMLLVGSRWPTGPMQRHIGYFTRMYFTYGRLLSHQVGRECILYSCAREVAIDGGRERWIHTYGVHFGACGDNSDDLVSGPERSQSST